MPFAIRNRKDDLIMEVFLSILALIYAFIGAKSIRYFKANILGIEYEIGTTTSLIGNRVSEFFIGIFLGVVTIPVMIIHSLIKGKK